MVDFKKACQRNILIVVNNRITVMMFSVVAVTENVWVHTCMYNAHPFAHEVGNFDN
jgi:hypothetical protein